MDKNKGILNIASSMASRVMLLLAALYVRRSLIQHIGIEANGLDSLFTSIIGFLSVAELGVGSAIIFSMYKPIVEGDKKLVTALYYLYRRLYRFIGAVIFAAGLAVIPFLPMLIKDYNTLDVSVTAAFVLTLISVTISYLYSAKTSLIEAHKNNYVTTGINTVAGLTRSVLQVAVILIWKSYLIYAACQIVETTVIWIITENVVRRLYPDVIGTKEELDPEKRAEVSHNIKAMFMHKIGGILVGSVDSIIISVFVGVVILGKYTNYTIIASSMAGFIALFFTPLTSVIGHLCASGGSNDIHRYFNHFYSLNYILGLIFFLGYYAVADNAVELCFGSGLELPAAIPFVITVNQFIAYMRYSVILFRDASGTFYYDRWKPLVEGLTNLFLSVLFVIIFPEGYEVVGVIAATIVTSLLICDIVEPHIIFKYVFKKPALKFCVRNYANIGFFVICLLAMEKLKISNDSNFLELLLNGGVSLLVSAAALGAISVVDRNFRAECGVLMGQVSTWLFRITQGRKGERII